MAGSQENLAFLLARSSLDDHEEILKAANETLKKSKKDVQAQNARAVALLKLDRYEDALQAFEDGGDTLENNAPLEYAYSLYKNGRLDEAAKVAGASSGQRSSKHAEAQSSYRLERFPRAQELYEDLAKSGHDDSESDLRINLGAVDAQLSWVGQHHLVKKTKADREDMEQFETAFNAACGYIARGELRQASTLLSRARDLCNASDDLSEDEKKAEVLPITVQQVYVLAQLGQVDEAEQLTKSLNPLDINDPSTRHIAQSNLLCLSNHAQNSFLSHRSFTDTKPSSRLDLPFRHQSAALHRNALALDLAVGNAPTSAVRTSSAASNNSLPTESAPAGVFKAAAQAKGQTGNIAIRRILPLLEKHPEDLGLLLTVVHLYLLTNNRQTAAQLLENYLARLEQTSSPQDQDARFAPGLVALHVALLKSLHRNSQTTVELAKATAHWRHKSKPGHGAASLFSAAGIELLESGSVSDRDLAHDAFQYFSEHNHGDKFAIAGLAASAAADDSLHRHPDQELPSVAELTKGIDATRLESLGIAKLPPPPTTRPKPSSKRKAEETKPNKSKRIRASQMPKEFDPNKKVDPERWLPMRDRSYYRPKGKKKRGAAQGMATQGGIEKEDSRPSTPSQTVQAQKQPGGGGKKKKGKR